ncbi:MAG: hypothetical protein EBT03_08185 [Betaproteobacteria bacterium]|nr:hypothetical protein [Betaproteobacteria bacterium]
MATPSIKSLRDGLGIDAIKAKILKAKLEKADYGTVQDVDRALEFANGAMEAYGVEAVRGDIPRRSPYADIVLLYVNTGDTYNTTLVYDTHKDKFLVASVGDWVERHGEEYEVY